MNYGIALLFLTGIVFYIFSTIGIGDGALMLIPVVEYTVGPKSVSPVINMSNMIGQPARLWLYWRHINWKIVARYLLGAIPGVLLGSLIYFRTDARAIRNLIGMFLIGNVFLYDFGKKTKAFPMRLEWFAPLGFGVNVISTLIGAVGPLNTPFYLNYGSNRLEIIATKTFNSFVMNILKLGIFATLGALKSTDLPFIMAIGSGAIIGNVVGKHFLEAISETTFRTVVTLGMAISGLKMLD